MAGRLCARSVLVYGLHRTCRISHGDGWQTRRLDPRSYAFDLDDLFARNQHPPAAKEASSAVTPYVKSLLWATPICYLFCYRWLGSGWLYALGWLQLPSPFNEELLLCTSA